VCGCLCLYLCLCIFAKIPALTVVRAGQPAQPLERQHSAAARDASASPYLEAHTHKYIYIYIYTRTRTHTHTHTRLLTHSGQRQAAGARTPGGGGSATTTAQSRLRTRGVQGHKNNWRCSPGQQQASRNSLVLVKARMECVCQPAVRESGFGGVLESPLLREDCRD
jgi:hypothetical protein